MTTSDQNFGSSLDEQIARARRRNSNRVVQSIMDISAALPPVPKDRRRFKRLRDFAARLRRAYRAFKGHD